jgi:hypothetical protein
LYLDFGEDGGDGRQLDGAVILGALQFSHFGADEIDSPGFPSTLSWDVAILR